MTHDDDEGQEMERLTAQPILATEHWFDVLQVRERGSVLGTSAEDLEEWVATARAELSCAWRAYRLHRDQALRRACEEPLSDEEIQPALDQF